MCGRWAAVEPQGAETGLHADAIAVGVVVGHTDRAAAALEQATHGRFEFSFHIGSRRRGIEGEQSARRRERGEVVVEDKEAAAQRLTGDAGNRAGPAGVCRSGVEGHGRVEERQIRCIDRNAAALAVAAVAAVAIGGLAEAGPSVAAESAAQPGSRKPSS